MHFFVMVTTAAFAGAAMMTDAMSAMSAAITSVERSRSDFLVVVEGVAAGFTDVSVLVVVPVFGGENIILS